MIGHFTHVTLNTAEQTHNYPFILYTRFEIEFGMRNRHYVEPFREKNGKPACHKIYQGRYYLLIFSSFS